jgi:uncharacterized RDD family membrane protein YckC
MRAPKARLRSLAFILDYLLLHCVASALSHWVCVAMLGALLPGKALGAKTLATSAKVIELTYQYGVSLLFPVAFLLISFVYFVALTHQSGASLGQALVGLRVVTRAGELPTIEQAAKRFFASIFTLMSAGFFFFLGAATRDGICFHDEASGTRVVLRDSWQEAVEAPESSSGFENKSPSKAA